MIRWGDLRPSPDRAQRQCLAAGHGSSLHPGQQAGCPTLWRGCRMRGPCLKPFARCCPSQQFPGWQLFIQVVSGGTLPLQMPFCRGWAWGHGQGLLPCSGSVESATIRFFPLHTKVLMAMLHFSKEELKKAFFKFSQISRLNSGPTQINRDFLLYAIYAVECSLKYLFPKDRRMHTIKRLLYRAPRKIREVHNRLGGCGQRKATVLL